MLQNNLRRTPASPYVAAQRDQINKTHPNPVHPELVEGLHFFSDGGQEGQGFDKLSLNG